MNGRRERRPQKKEEAVSKSRPGNIDVEALKK